MRIDDFKTDAPGRLVEREGLSGRYLAFVPAPLPPKLDFSPGLVQRLSTADRAIGELKGVGRMLPDPHLLIGPILRREAVASSRIEGTITDLAQLLLFEADPTEGEEFADRQEVLNYVNALTFGLDRLASLPISLRLMKEMHQRLMSGVRGEDKTPGEFRDRQNMIGRAGQSPAEARFVPPPVAEMKVALDDLERFIHADSSLPVLVDLALIHYQFEAIHPFLDGNGRLGRLLISLLLCERGCLGQPLLYLSDYFERNREDYANRLLAVGRSGDWVGWIGFFLDGIAAQSAVAVERCNRLLDLRMTYRSRFSTTGHPAILLQVIDHLFARPATSIGQVGSALGIAFVTARKYVERLQEAGILREVTGKARDRIYMATEILRVVGEP